MDGPSRTPFPTPQPLGPVRAATSPEEGTPQSASTMASVPFSSASSGGGYYDSPTSTSSTASTLLWGGSGGGVSRKDSTESAPASTSAAAEAMMLAKRESAFAVSPKHVNANSYCGRHSKEFLFGGKGFGDLWRAVTKK